MGMIMRLALTLLVSSLLLGSVLADKPAARTLNEMVKLINDGKFDNNFFDGDMLAEKTGNTKQQQVAGCLLDKVSAIKNENGLEQFPNDLKVDLAACCTKDSNEAGCIKQLAPAYDALVAQTDGKSGNPPKCLRKNASTTSWQQ